MSKLRLYPAVKVAGQDLSHVKSITVPNQSMTLKDILKRFVRREALPIEKQGVYFEDSDIDLEKAVHADLTEKEDMIREQREKVSRMKKKIEDNEKAKEEEKSGAKSESAKQSEPKAGTPAPKAAAGAGAGAGKSGAGDEGS